MNDFEQVDLQNRSTTFVVVFLMLCGLTALSFWISRSYLMDHRLAGWAAMIAVSISKALLVGMFFMHLLWERHWKYALTIPAMIMSTLLVLLLVPDIGFRYGHYSRERSESAAEQQSEEVAIDRSSPTNMKLKK
jgi:cytochrome c oxidase subunit IV